MLCSYIFTMSFTVSSKRKKQSHCFVPGCTSGYKSNKQKVSLFSVPKDPDMKNKWSRLIPRKDKELDETCWICELHFEPQLIERYYSTVINGKEELIKRGKPALTKEAIPTIFPNLSKYLSVKLPKKRSCKVLNRTFPPAKKQKLSLSETDFINTDQPKCSKRCNIEEFCEVNVPTKFWSKIRYENFKNTICFAVWLSPNNFTPDKSITVKEDDGVFSCSVHIRNCLLYEKIIHQKTELQTLIDDVETYIPCNGVAKIDEFKNIKLSKKLILHNDIIKSVNCKGIVSKKSYCSFCKYQRVLLLNRLAYKSNCKKYLQSKYKKTKELYQVSKKLKHKSVKYSNKIEELKTKFHETSKNQIINYINMMTEKQKLAFNECIKASKRKSTKGMNYDKHWLLECIIMRMKSPRLYEHLRINGILSLPSKSCIRKYLSSFFCNFGFNPKLFEALKLKMRELDVYHKHGCLIFDELKLSENLHLQKNGLIQGFVDYGSFTTVEKKNEISDHGLVLLFQPFVGSWVQILGVFSTKNNISGNILSKILLEAVILSENSDLFIDCITGDAAPWNRAMWHEFGIGVSKNGEIKCKVIHPVDPSRYLYFISDFPHLIKCLRNSFLQNGFNTPDGEVRPEFIKAAFEEDNKMVRLKVMPKITKAHISPNAFEKMRVSIAFQLFSMEVVKGLYIYNEEIKTMYGNPVATVNFIKKINTLIGIMTSRLKGKGLIYYSEEFYFLKNFLLYLDLWESHCGKNKGFISKNTALGFRVSIMSTLSLVEYLTKEVKYTYLLTSKLSQDKIENLFSIIRQCKGCNDHPTAAEFLTIVQCLSFSNIAKPPKSGNVNPDIVEILISPETTTNTNNPLDIIDILVDNGNLTEISSVFSTFCKEKTDTGREESDVRMIFHIAGYVAHKFLKKTNCIQCQIDLQQDKFYSDISSFTTNFDQGGLIYASSKLFSLLHYIETKFTTCLTLKNIHKESIVEFLDTLDDINVILIGCPLHCSELTKKIMKFFVMSRLQFYLKAHNRNKDVKREKQKLLKLRRCK